MNAKIAKINQNLFFAPTLVIVILLLGFFVLPVNLNDSFSYYPFIFLLTIAFVYLKLSIFLFAILDKFSLKSQTAFSLLVNLILAILQLWTLSLATRFLRIESYPFNTFQFLAINQFGFFIQIFLNNFWQAKRLNLIVILYYLFFLVILYLRIPLDLRWSIIFYQFIAGFGLFLELFSLHQTIILIKKQN